MWPTTLHNHSSREEKGKQLYSTATSTALWMIIPQIQALVCSSWYWKCWTSNWDGSHTIPHFIIPWVWSNFPKADWSFHSYQYHSHCRYPPWGSRQWGWGWGWGKQCGNVSYLPAYVVSSRPWSPFFLQYTRHPMLGDTLWYNPKLPWSNAATFCPSKDAKGCVLSGKYSLIVS